MRRISALILVLLMSLSLFAAQGEDAAPENAYQKIKMSFTREDIETLFDEGIKQNEYIRFDDVLCAFFESGRLQAKSLYYQDIRDVAAPTKGDFAAVRDKKQGTPEQELSDILGEGTEVLRMNLSDEDDAGQRKLIAWKNAEGGVMEALFEIDDGEWILFALGEIA